MGLFMAIGELAVRIRGGLKKGKNVEKLQKKMDALSKKIKFYDNDYECHVAYVTFFKAEHAVNAHRPTYTNTRIHTHAHTITYTDAHAHTPRGA